jgi:hypothetical protein
MVQIGEQNIPDPQKKEFYDGTYVGIGTTLVPILFRVPFTRDPKVVVCLKKIDLGSDINRLLVRAENIRLDGFDLCFETWNDSRVYDAAASWIAVTEWRGS